VPLIDIKHKSKEQIKSKKNIQFFLKILHNLFTITPLHPIASDKWIEFREIKASEKLEKEKQKEERKLATLEKRKQAEKKN